MVNMADLQDKAKQWFPEDPEKDETATEVTNGVEDPDQIIDLNLPETIDPDVIVEGAVHEIEQGQEPRKHYKATRGGR